MALKQKLTNKSGETVYPLTEASQVIVDDKGTRLSTVLSEGNAGGGSGSAVVPENVMTKDGGTFTGDVVAAENTNGNAAILRNIVLVEDGTDLTTLNVPAGTIIMVVKEG